MPDAEPRGQACLKLTDLRAEDVLAVVEHPMDARVDVLFQTLVLGLQVDERARCRHPSRPSICSGVMRIHVKIGVSRRV